MSATRWVRLSKIAQHCGLSPHSIYKMVQADIIPHGRAGRILVFDVEAVDEWIRQRGNVGRIEFPASERRAAQRRGRGSKKSVSGSPTQKAEAERIADKIRVSL